jgi:hypothetical protein
VTRKKRSGRGATGRATVSVQIGSNPARVAPPSTADALVGGTRGDNVRHVICRRAFLREFFRDERVEDLFRGWEQRAGVAAVVEEFTTARETRKRAVVERVDAAARSMGFEGWRQLPDLPEEELEDWLRRPDARKISAEAAAALDELVARFHRLGQGLARTMVEEAWAFAKRCELPWPWLVVELVREFILRPFRRIASAEEVAMLEERWVGPVDPPVTPGTELRVTAQPGETWSQFQARIQDETARIGLQFASSALPRGSMPRRKEQMLERDAAWFYRYRFVERSVKGIATRDYGEEAADNHRKTIRQGIERAAKYLNPGLPIEGL